jgi:hypothetical protein
MKLKNPLWAFLVILGLVITCAVLFNQRSTYRLENRHLILQNDSLMSVNIELTQQLDTTKSTVLSK